MRFHAKKGFPFARIALLLLLTISMVGAAAFFAGAYASSEAALTVNFRGLRLSGQGQWQTVPLSGAFDVYDADGDTFLGRIASHMGEGVLAQDEKETLMLSKGQERELLLRPIENRMTGGYQWEAETRVHWDGQSDFSIPLWAYAREGLFSLRYLVEGNDNKGSAAFEVLNKNRESILRFETDESGLYQTYATLPEGAYFLRQLRAAQGAIPMLSELPFEILPYKGEEDILPLVVDNESVPKLSSVGHSWWQVGSTFGNLTGGDKEGKLTLKGMAMGDNLWPLTRFTVEVGNLMLTDEQGALASDQEGKEIAAVVFHIETPGIQARVTAYDRNGSKISENILKSGEEKDYRGQGIVSLSATYLNDKGAAVVPQGFHSGTMDVTLSLKGRSASGESKRVAGVTLTAQASYEYSYPDTTGVEISNPILGDLVECTLSVADHRAQVLLRGEYQGGLLNVSISHIGGPDIENLEWALSLPAGFRGEGTQVTADGAALPLKAVVKGEFSDVLIADMNRGLASGQEVCMSIPVSGQGTGTAFAMHLLNTTGLTATADNPMGYIIGGTLTADSLADDVLGKVEPGIYAALEGLVADGADHEIRLLAAGTASQGATLETQGQTSVYLYSSYSFPAFTVLTLPAEARLAALPNDPAALVTTDDSPREGGHWVSAASYIGDLQKITAIGAYMSQSGFQVPLTLAAAPGATIQFTASATPSGSEGESYAYAFTATQTQRVTGSLYEDANENGQRDEGERGAQGRMVVWQSIENSAYRTVAYTDGEGRFSITPLTGSGLLLVDLPAYTQIQGAKANEGLYTAATLKDGQGMNIDIGFVSMGAIRFVASETGVNTPVAGVEATLSMNGAVVRTLTTDSQGLCLFDGLEPGIYDLTAVLPEGWRGQGQFVEAGDAYTANQITVAQSSQVELMASMERFSVINATIQGSGNLPGGRAQLLREGQVVSDFSLDDHSDLRIEALVPGRYDLVVHPPENGAVASVDGVSVMNKTETSIQIDLVSGQEKDIALSIEALASLHLSVEGKGVEGLMVSLAGAEAADGPLDSHGSLSFDRLLPGQYTLSVTLPQNASSVEGKGWNTEGDRALCQVSLAPGTNLTVDSLGIIQWAAVSGVVWKDINSDGVLETDEVGLSGCAVQLERREGENYIQMKSVTTDEKGQYAFTEVEPGDYRLRLILSEGIAVSPGIGDNQFAADGLTGGFTLVSGQEKEGLSAGVITPSGLKVLVFMDSNGDGGKGIYDPLIAGTILRVLDRNGEIAMEMTTNKNGEALFQSLPPGEYTLFAILPEGYWFSEKGSGFSENSNAIEKADARQGESDTFTLREGEVFALGVGCVETGILSGKTWMDTNGDGIMQESEPGLGDCLITAVSNKGGNTYSVYSDETGAYSLEVRSGTYNVRFGGPEGTIFTRYSKEGGKMRSILTQEGARSGEKEYGIGAGKRLADENVGWIQGGVIQGIAFLDGNYNGIFDEGEEVLPGVSIELTKYANGVSLGTVITDSHGAFRFDGLRGLDYRLKATLPDDRLVYTEVHAEGLSSDDVYGNLFANRSGRKDSTCDLKRMEDGESIILGIGAVYPSQLSGTVFVDSQFNGLYDGGENGAANVAVSLYGENQETPVATVRTDARGTFQFTNVMPQAYTIEVEYPTGFTKTFKGEGNRVNLLTESHGSRGATLLMTIEMGTAEKELWLGIVEPGQVSGLVYGDANDDGIHQEIESGFEGVMVELIDEAGSVVSVQNTDAQGAFRFVDVLPGTYSLCYNLPGHSDFSLKSPVETQVTEGELLYGTGAPFSIAMAEAYTAAPCGVVALGSIEGVAFRDHGGTGTINTGDETLPGVKISYGRIGRGEEPKTVISGEDGWFILDGLRPGDYEITLVFPDGMISTIKDARTELPEGDAILQLSLEMGERISDFMAGCVIPGGISGSLWLDRNNDGARNNEEPAMEGITVTAVHASGKRETTLTDGEGAYAFDLLMPGTYRLEVMLPPHHTGTSPDRGESKFSGGGDTMHATGISLVESQYITGINGGLLEYSTISGKAWTDEAQAQIPLEGVAVSLHELSSGKVLGSLVTGEDGSYRFENILPGTYEIRAEMPKGYQFVTPWDKRLESGYVSIINESGGSGTIEIIMGQSPEGMDIGGVRTGMLGDYAWLDENGNGLQDAGEPGIPGLTVSLYQNGQLVGQQVTDAYGYYLFTSVYPTETEIRVSMYNEIKPTKMREEYPLISSVLLETEGCEAVSILLQVESGKNNFNGDLGFVLRTPGTYPAAITAPPTQNWQWPN